MDFIDDLMIDVEEDEATEMEDDLTVSKFLAETFLQSTEPDNGMEDDLLLMDEDLIAPDEDFLDPFQDMTKNITEGNAETAVVRRRKAAGVIDSLEKYANVFTNMSLHIKSQDENDKVTREIDRRLSEYYEHYNNILPSAIVSREFFEAADKVFPDNQYKKQYGMNRSLSNFIISEIRNGTSILIIVEILKEFFSIGNFVDGNNHVFLLTSINESKALTFLNKLKAYHESELLEYEKETGFADMVQTTVDNNINKFLVVRKESQETNETEQLTYPSSIYLDSGLFVCGNCGAEEKYEYPFLRSLLMNSSKDDFLTILPTLEVCTSCGYYNMLPANYYEVMVKNIREEFKRDYNLSNLRENLGKLSGDFSRYPYELPRSVIMQALPADLKTLYQERIVVNDNFIEATSTAPADMSKSIESYKNKVKSLMAAKQLSFAKIRTGNDLELVNINYEVSRNLAGPVYALAARVYCASIGSDYNMMKTKAMNSLLFFLEDYVPFIINPFSVIREYAANLVGLMDDDTYASISREYQEVKNQLDGVADYLAFVPIIAASSQHKYLEQFMQDDFTRNFINYVTDTMIIYSMREDLIDLCIVGQSAPFLPTKVKLKNLLTSSQIESMLKKFNKSLKVVMDSPITDFLNTRRNWLSNKSKQCKEHKSLFRAFLNKDLYEVIKIVHGTGSEEKGIDTKRYGHLKESLEQFMPQFEGKSKLEFYYGDQFQGEDFTAYSEEGIGLFYIIPKEEGEDFPHYLDEIKNRGNRNRNASIKNREWFVDHLSDFFAMLKDNLLAQQKYQDVLFMDIMKNLTLFGPKIITQAFSMNDNVLSFASIEESFDVKSNFNREKEFAKQILYLYPYTNSTLQLMAAECDSEDVDTIVSLLLSEPDLLEEELSTAPGIVKARLTEQFGLNLN